MSQLKDALVRTFAFFEAHPEKRVTGTMAMGPARSLPLSPFDKRADCFCFLGRLARELGEDRKAEPGRLYEHGYSEIRAALVEAGVERPTPVVHSMYVINDQNDGTRHTPRVLEREREFLKERGLIDA